MSLFYSCRTSRIATSMPSILPARLTISFRYHTIRIPTFSRQITAVRQNSPWQATGQPAENALRGKRREGKILWKEAKKDTILSWRKRRISQDRRSSLHWKRWLRICFLRIRGMCCSERLCPTVSFQSMNSSNQSGIHCTRWVAACMFRQNTDLHFAWSPL